MTPAPPDKPLHSQLEEAEKSLESMEKYGPDEDETTTSFWHREAPGCTIGGMKGSKSLF